MSAVRVMPQQGKLTLVITFVAMPLLRRGLKQGLLRFGDLFAGAGLPGCACTVALIQRYGVRLFVLLSPPVRYRETSGDIVPARTGITIALGTFTGLPLIKTHAPLRKMSVFGSPDIIDGSDIIKPLKMNPFRVAKNDFQRSFRVFFNSLSPLLIGGQCLVRNTLDKSIRAVEIIRSLVDLAGKERIKKLVHKSVDVLIAGLSETYFTIRSHRSCVRNGKEAYNGK